MKSARACLTPCKKPHVRIPLTAEHPAPPALRDLTGPDRTVDRRTARRAQRLAALRGLLAGAAAPADRGRRRPRCAARPWGARPLRPRPPGSERPRLPAGPARLLTCSPPAGGPSARRALRPPVPGRCHLRPWKRRAGRSGVTQRGRPASRLPPPAQASASRGRGRHTRSPSPPPAVRPVLAPPGGPPGPASPTTSEGAELRGPLPGETEAPGPRRPGRSQLAGPSVLRATPANSEFQSSLAAPSPPHPPPTQKKVKIPFREKANSIPACGAVLYAAPKLLHLSRLTTLGVRFCLSHLFLRKVSGHR